MKAIILVFSLIGLVGCSDISVVKNGNLISENPEIDGDERVELIPYSIIWNTDGTPYSSEPSHEYFIEFLERRSIVLSNPEKDLIRTDAPEFKVYLDMQFDGELINPSGMSFNSQVNQMSYELEIHLDERVITITDGTFVPGLSLSFRENIPSAGLLYNLTHFELSSKFSLAPNEELKINTQSVMIFSSKEHLHNYISVETIFGGANRRILSVRNSKTKSVCDYYTGNLIDQYCPFNF